jgi:hypothetical protein
VKGLYIAALVVVYCNTLQDLDGFIEIPKNTQLFHIFTSEDIDHVINPAKKLFSKWRRLSKNGELFFVFV